MTFFSRLKSVFIKLSIVFLVVIFFLFIYLDSKVKGEFEQQAWDIPAKIYARSLSFSVDKELSVNDLKKELSLLGYRKKVKAVANGEYEVYGSTFVIKVRSFKFWDGGQDSTTIQLTIKNGLIKSLSNYSNNQSINFLRLDPLLLGSIQVSANSSLQDRQIIQLEDLPKGFVEALLVIEDRAFFNHWGLSIKGIARAFWTNVRQGEIQQGGSTLTQQLIKNHFLTNERSFWRKANEAIMALLTEYHYDKNTILQAYINEVYLAQNANTAIHGFARASEFYFDQNLSDLNLAQIALLVSLVKGPSYYNPRRQPKRALKRRNLVLKKMFDNGLVDRRSYEQELSRSLMVVDNPPIKTSRVPALVSLIKKELKKDYDQRAIREKGLKLFTSLDPLMQSKAERSLKKRIAKLNSNSIGKSVSNKLQGAIIVSDYSNGEIKAIVGDRNPSYVGFNRAIDAYRQTGSVIKPLVYLSALKKPNQFNWTSPIQDRAFTLKGSDGSLWQPKNYDHKEHGDEDGFVALADGLVFSYNLATAQLAMKVGIDNIVSTILDFGFDRKLSPFPSIALGSKEMSPLEVTRLYQVIANSGELVEPTALVAVQSQDGRLLKRYPKTPTQVIDKEAVAIMKHLLNRVTKEGTAKSLKWHFPNVELAGKTGTTNDLKDSWFAGFDGRYLGVVWLGLDDNKPMGLTGATGALLVWVDFFKLLEPTSIALDDSSGLIYGYKKGSFFSQLTRCKNKPLVPFYNGFIPADYAICR